MKKLYLICLLLWSGIAAHAQVTTTIWSGGAPGDADAGSYKTGAALYTPPPPTGGTYSRSDGIIIPVTNSSSARQAGYAVFDLSTIPSGATISSVTLGVNVSGFTSGTYSACVTYGHTVDFRTVTVASTLLTDCTTTAAGGTMLFTALTSGAVGSYGTGVGDITMNGVTGSPICNFVQANAGSSAVTISFSGGGYNVYNFKGETGTQTLTGLHAPYLQITYCYPPTGLSAVITPTAVCSGSSFVLAGSASGASSYKWKGPAGFTATTPTVTVTASPASSGTYTFTAYTSCGVGLDSTWLAVPTYLTVLSSPATMITTTTTVCSGNTIYMSDVTGGGTWSSSNTLSATVDNFGKVVAGAVQGTAVISYRITSCAATTTVTVNNPPGPIGVFNQVCEAGGVLTLTDAVTGGTWSSSATTNATIDPVSGVVTGVLAGAITISYFTGGCPSTSYGVTVNPLPGPITGATDVCATFSVPLSDATPSGTWSTSNTAIATANSATGDIWGVSAGTCTVTYTLPTGCYMTRNITVNPLPAAITGPNAVCETFSINLSDATAGGTWSSTVTTVATTDVSTGVTYGVASGTTDIRYILPVTGCYVSHSVTVNPPPAPISGLDNVCELSSITLSDDTPLGTWSSQSTVIATVDANLGDVTGSAAGVTHITYTLPTTCYATYSITVNPLPSAIITPAGPTTFCASGNVTLNASTGTGYTYQWYSNGSPISGANTSSYVSNSTELITVEVTDANSCVKVSAGEQITLIPAVVIAVGGPTTFCHTGNVMLSVPLAPSIVYQWKLNGANIPGANSHIHYATEDGIYTCDLVVPGGCASTTPPLTVTVYPLPNPVVTRIGSLLTTAGTYLSYQWYLNAVAIPGATTNTYTPTINGSYRVRVTDGNGCTNYSEALNITDLAVGQLNVDDIHIYPNPANSVVHVDAPFNVHTAITSVDGKQLISQDAKDIDITSLPAGLYMILVYDQDGNRLIVQKLVKE